MKDLQPLLDPSTLQPGIIDGLPFAEYLAINAANQSAAKRAMTGCMRSVRDELLDVGDSSSTPQQLLGDLVHMLIHETDRFDETVVVGPNARRNSNDWKAFAADHPGKTLVKETEVAEAHALKAAVDAHPRARNLIGNSRCEQSMVWWDSDVGVWCKCRVDYLVPDVQIADLKTAQSASASKFADACAKLGYAFQAAFALRGYRILTGAAMPWSWIVAEKGSDIVVDVYDADEEDILAAEQTVVAILRRIVLSIEDDHWPSVIRVPRWAPDLHPERWVDVGPADVDVAVALGMEGGVA